MCGLCGIVSLGGAPVDLAVLQEMNDRLAHRGPDGEGFLLVSPQGDRLRHDVVRSIDAWPAASPASVGLGHRRLAIIDLSERGLQPLRVDDADAWIAYNGELYNHLELRAELEARGRRFTTRTDTEVLLRAYLEWGEECLSRLQGMFAFAIWDGRTGRLFCARDRLGIKPFYYAHREGSLLFASEIKALLAHPSVRAVPDDDAVVGFLVHGNSDFLERTVLRDVASLPGGHALTADLRTGAVEVRPFWRFEPRDDGARSDSELVGGLRDLLLETTRKHLISDVQVGSCLSGGLDSSVVVGLIGQIQAERPADAAAVGEHLFTFTSCYEHREIDEREYALAVAQSVGATPQLVFPSAEDFWNDFERIAWHQDMPFCGLSYYAQWRVMRAAREAGVKVLLDGQGGDEVFGGYAKFRYAYLASLLAARRLGTMTRELGATLRQGDLYYVLNPRNGFRYLPARLRRVLNVDSMLKDALRADLGAVVADASTPATRWWGTVRDRAGGNGRLSPLQRIQLDDILVDTLPLILRHEDRSSMAFSIEARVPLLDHLLVEYGLSLPDHLKFNRGWSKYAMRESTRGVIPEGVRLRTRKLGFAAPDRAWLDADLRPQVTELINDELRCARYVDPAVLRRWYAGTATRSANTASYLGLFRVLAVEMWMRAFAVA